MMGRVMRRCEAQIAVTMSVGLLLTAVTIAGADPGRRDSWKKDWELRPDYVLSIDAAGFRYPTEIAFVPDPGDGPKDPLYFVTELKGTVKVVTNDRTVHTFATGLFDPSRISGGSETGKVREIGMAGLCLAPEQGYVFVSYAALDANGRMRNHVVRFESEPGTFSLKPHGRTSLSHVFADQPSAGSHMIGPMMIRNGHLFVNVGDAQVPRYAQDVNVLAGKVLRMTLDGEPLPSNPFYKEGEPERPANYVWASGFRNPFGIEAVRGGLFVSDVGPSVDRFVRVERGSDYGYDGSDWSISSHADIVFAPSVSPVGMDYLPEESSLFAPSDRGRVYLATSGLQGAAGPSRHGEKAILTIQYDFERNRVIGRPRRFMRYRGESYQNLVTAAFGPDGLYVVPLHSFSGRRGAILKVTHDPEQAHPFVMGRAEMLMKQKGCTGCHRASQASPAPQLDRDELTGRLLERLNSEAYNRRSRRLDARNEPPFENYEEARRKIRVAEGIEKVRLWVKNRLLEPRFDDPDAQMPNLDLTEQEAKILTDHLVREPPDRSLFAATRELVSEYIPYPQLRHLAYFLIAGFLGGAVFSAIGAWGIALLKRRRQGDPVRSHVESG